MYVCVCVYIYIYIFIDIYSCNPYMMFIGRTDAETETPVLWPPHVKS